jgi:hypothetical protein
LGIALAVSDGSDGQWNFDDDEVRFHKLEQLNPATGA